MGILAIYCESLRKAWGGDCGKVAGLIDWCVLVRGMKTHQHAADAPRTGRAPRWLPCAAGTGPTHTCCSKSSFLYPATITGRSSWLGTRGWGSTNTNLPALLAEQQMVECLSGRMGEYAGAYVGSGPRKSVFLCYLGPRRVCAWPGRARTIKKVHNNMPLPKYFCMYTYIQHKKHNTIQNTIYTIYNVRCTMHDTIMGP